jgi:hypothetical protein
MLLEIATVLRRRGETAEAERAIEEARRLEHLAATRLQEITTEEIRRHQDDPKLPRPPF